MVAEKRRNGQGSPPTPQASRPAIPVPLALKELLGLLFRPKECLQADRRSRFRDLYFPECSPHPASTPLQAPNHAEVLKQETQGSWKTIDHKWAKREKTNPVPGKKRKVSVPRNTHKKENTALLCALSCRWNFVSWDLGGCRAKQRSHRLYWCLEPRLWVNTRILTVVKVSGWVHPDMDY